MHRWLLTIAGVLTLVTIGGQCRGSLAQGRTLETLTLTVPDTDAHRRHPTRTAPMSAKEWAAAYDACVAALGQPVILATRTPGISAGVGCDLEFDGQ
jgi:hypothetical protein